MEERQRTEIYAIIFYLKTFAGRRGAKRIPLFAENFLLKGGQGGTEGVGWSKKKKKSLFLQVFGACYKIKLPLFVGCCCFMYTELEILGSLDSFVHH